MINNNDDLCTVIFGEFLADVEIPKDNKEIFNTRDRVYWKHTGPGIYDGYLTKESDDKKNYAGIVIIPPTKNNSLIRVQFVPPEAGVPFEVEQKSCKQLELDF